MEDAVKDIIAKLRGSYRFDYVMVLQPTSPLRTSEHIDQAVEKYFSQRKSDADTLISVKEIENKVLWALGERQDDGYLYSHFDRALSTARRQSLPKCYAPNGAIYLAKADGFDQFYNDQTLPYVMDDISSMDVDYKEDLQRAAQYLRARGVA